MELSNLSWLIKRLTTVLGHGPDRYETDPRRTVRLSLLLLFSIDIVLFCWFLINVLYVVCVYWYSCERQSPVLRPRQAQAGTPSRALYTAIACLSMPLTLHQTLRHVHFYVSTSFSILNTYYIKGAFTLNNPTHPHWTLETFGLNAPPLSRYNDPERSLKPSFIDRP